MQVIINDKNVFGIPAGTLSEVLSEEENGAIWVDVNGKKTYLAPWEYEVKEVILCTSCGEDLSDASEYLKTEGYCSDCL